MNRRKKIITKFNNKDKRANAKLHKSNKPAYVSKAERAKLAEQDAAPKKVTPKKSKPSTDAEAEVVDDQ